MSDKRKRGSEKTDEENDLELKTKKRKITQESPLDEDLDSLEGDYQEDDEIIQDDEEEEGESSGDDFSEGKEENDNVQQIPANKKTENQNHTDSLIDVAHREKKTMQEPIQQPNPPKTDPIVVAQRPPATRVTPPRKNYNNRESPKPKIYRKVINKFTTSKNDGGLLSNKIFVVPIIVLIFALIFYVILKLRREPEEFDDLEKLMERIDGHDELLIKFHETLKKISETFNETKEHEHVPENFDELIRKMKEEGLLDIVIPDGLVTEETINEKLNSVKVKIDSKLEKMLKKLEDSISSTKSEIDKLKDIDSGDMDSEEINKIKNDVSDVYKQVSEIRKLFKDLDDNKKLTKEEIGALEKKLEQYKNDQSKETKKMVEEMWSKLMTKDQMEKLKDSGLVEFIEEYFSTQKTLDFDLDLLYDKVKMIIDHELEMLEADKLNRTDFALETMGSKVVEVDTIYDSHTNFFWRLLPFLELKKYLNKNHVDQNLIISNVKSVGRCLPIVGNSGTIVIELGNPVYPDGFSIDHIPKALSPNDKTAPKSFRVYGSITKRAKQYFLGEYTYDYKKSVQTFDYQPTENEIRPYYFFKFEILDNYGEEEYTCIYRFRIHGQRYESPPESITN